MDNTLDATTVHILDSIEATHRMIHICISKAETTEHPEALALLRADLERGLVRMKALLK